MVLTRSQVNVVDFGVDTVFGLFYECDVKL